MGSTVMPGRMPAGYLGITLSITLFGAMLSQIFVVPLADNFGRKFMFEICLIIMFFASALSAFSLYNTQLDAPGMNVVGSLCFWRFCLGVGVGGMYPLTGAIVAEYSPKFTRGSYLSLAFAAHGFGIFLACIITIIACAGIKERYPATFFPLSIEGCSTYTALDGNGLLPCPAATQQAYNLRVYNSAPSQIQYIWRSVVSAGAFGALLTFIFSRLYIVETPRFMAQVAGEYAKAIDDLAHQCEIDYRDQLLAAEAGHEESKGEGLEVEHLEQVYFREFLARHGVNLLLASLSWFFVNIVFSGLLILIEEPARVIGFNKGNYWQPATDECAGLAVGYLTVCLSALIPGYYVSVATIDKMGRKVTQFMGFVMMAVWCSACAGSFDKLLPPNNDKLMDGTDPVWRSEATGWCVMFACTFFFAAWGPLSTSFILPAELFPSAWRATGYGLCAAAGSLGSIVGIWIFTYASQPFPRQVTYAYPCTRTDPPADLYNMGVGACVRLPACPVGRQLPAEYNVGYPCSYCPDGTKSGCYPYGLGTAGSMAIMVPILAVGAVVTMLLPLTDNRSLEEISLDEQEHENFLGGQRRTLELPDISSSSASALKRDVYMERGYEEAHPRGTEADPAMRAQRELERQRARADMLAKERAKAQLVAAPGQRVPAKFSDTLAGLKVPVSDESDASGEDVVHKKQTKYGGGRGGGGVGSAAAYTEAMPPSQFSQYDDEKIAKLQSPSVPLVRSPPGADEDAPMARPPPGLEVQTAATKINQRLQSSEKEPPLARSPPGAFSEPRSALSSGSPRPVAQPSPGMDLDDDDTGDSFDQIPVARTPPGEGFVSSAAPPPVSDPPVKKSAFAVFAEQLLSPLSVPPMAKAPPGLAERPPLVIVPTPPAPSRTEEDEFSDRTVPISPPPQALPLPRPASLKLTTALPPPVPAARQEVENPLRPAATPSPSPAVSLFLPPARMAQRPAGQQQAWSGRGLQIGLGRSLGGLGPTPRHLPPALAPRSSTGKDSPTKRSSSRTGVAGIDVDDESGLRLAYDEPAASMEPAMESLASSIAAARLLTDSLSSSRGNNPPAPSASGPDAGADTGPASSTFFGSRAREASLVSRDPSPPDDPRYADS